jgi:hypothetical protein
MSARDTLALILTVLFLVSMALPMVPWVRFLARCQREERVDRHGFRRAAVFVGLGALCSGLFFVAMGLMLGESPVQDSSVGAYVVYFLTCPSVLALLALAAFGASVLKLKAKYGE